VGSVVPGPIGAIAKFAGDALAGNGKPRNPSIMTAAPPAAINIARAGLAAPVSQMHPLTHIPQLPYPLGPGRGNTTQSQPADWDPGSKRLQSGEIGCPRGYHRNKTGYHTKKYGYIEAGSICVKNRRRNPLNPRALSRSMARLSSAKKAARFLGQVSIREGGCGCKGRR
jgi:hypothetical protein